MCTADGVEVAWNDLAKGYEIGQGQHVVISPEELEALDPEATRTIDIVDFVEQDQIDPIYFQHAYYLVPDRAPAHKAYALLREALRRTGKVAIARFVLRTKQYLCAIRPRDGALVLSTMLYDDEVLPAEGVENLPDAATLDERELSMAEQLIDQLSGDFEPERYEDEYRQRVLDLIEAKAAGEVVVSAPVAAPEVGGVVDLVAALEASLEEAQKRASA